MARPKSNYRKEDTLFVRVDPDLKEQIQARAQSEGLAMASWIRQVIIKEIGKKSQRIKGAASCYDLS